MNKDLNNVMAIAGAGMKAQSARMRVTSENIANADSVAQVPGGNPYRRKTLTFKNELDKKLGVNLVKVAKDGTDTSDYQYKYEPGNPLADVNGYVAYPNVNVVIEQADMREAQASYEANLNVIDTTRSLLNNTISLIK
jgi:flagellar basal-body rod protein FlgC